MNIFEVSAVLFDMDGTLVDSTATVERTWTRWAKQRGLDPASVIGYAHGRPTADTIRMARPDLDAQAEAARLLAEEELDPAPALPIPGAMEAVRAADTFRMWAVVTSASRKLAQLRLTLADYPAAPYLVSADDIERGKPDPQGFLIAAGALHARPEDCVVFEDTPAGLEAGKRAGAKVIGLSTTFRASDLPADLVVEDFRAVRIVPLPSRRFRVEVRNPVAME